MLIKTFVVGALQTNCYIVTDENTLDCVVIDPGAESGNLLNYIEENKLTLRYILLTHGHFDHTMAVSELQEETDVPVYINSRDTTPNAATSNHKFCSDKPVNHYSEGDRLMVGGLEFAVIETPGHSSGSVTLKCENALFTGDTLFRDSCGRTDIGDGSMNVLSDSLKKLNALEGDYEVYPGHADATTLERERRFNYYLKYAVEG